MAGGGRPGRYGSAAEVAEDVERLLGAAPAPLAGCAARLRRAHRRLWTRAGEAPAPATATATAQEGEGAAWRGSRFFVQVRAWDCGRVRLH